MAKLILLSVIYLSIIVPIRASKRASPRRALKSAQWTIVAYVFVWAWMCLHLYTALVHVE